MARGGLNAPVTAGESRKACKEASTAGRCQPRNWQPMRAGPMRRAMPPQRPGTTGFMSTGRAALSACPQGKAETGRSGLRETSRRPF